MPTYIVTKRGYSDKAKKYYGSSIVWKFVSKTKLRPPQDETSFRQWLWMLVKEAGKDEQGREKGGPGDYAVTRTQNKGERRGFHPIGFYHIDQFEFNVLKRYSEVKSHPGLPSSRQVWHKGTIERKRLRKNGVGRGRKLFK